MEKYRPSKDEYYLNIAKEVARRSTCMSTKIGAIIVKDDQIVATGYNGAPRKVRDCYELGICLRRKLEIPSGKNYEICRSVHAEQNCIINAARAGVSILGGTIYLVGLVIVNGKEQLIDALPCFICKKMIINAGLERFVGRTKDGKIREQFVKDWVSKWREKDMLEEDEIHFVDYYNN
jgi:dCMP deaminase